MNSTSSVRFAIRGFQQVSKLKERKNESYNFQTSTMMNFFAEKRSTPAVVWVAVDAIECIKAHAQK